MAIFRVTASKDNTITNAFQENLITRGTGSNMGASDVLEVFTIYAQASSASVEKARFLIEFPINEIQSKRSSGEIPESGSVEFYLNLYNTPHGAPVPTNYELFVLPISQSWEEGKGIDMEEYTDLTYDKEGSNWLNNASASTWTTQGGDFLYDQAITASFTTGLEDMKLDVTPIVEDWLTGSSGGQYNNYGFGVQLSTTNEAAEVSYYTKKFFARKSEYYYKRPTLEARWDDSLKDDRGTFYASSSRAPASDNLNEIYLYNRIRGRLKDIPNAPTSASLRYSMTGNNQVSAAVTRVSRGIYKASLSLETTASTIYDVWYSGSTAYHTGTIQVNSFNSNVVGEDSKYVISLTNNDYYYHPDQKTRFKLYSRLKNWSPNLYTVAQNSPENLIIEDAIYKIYRIVDGQEVVPYGSGSTKFTQLSYNVSGNYFDLDMSLFEVGYEYGIKFSFYDDYIESYKEQPHIFKFKVVN